MKIPKKAALAMIEQLGLTPDEIDASHVHALEAAAPFIAAQALRDRAQTIKDHAPECGLVHVDDVVEDIRDMADFLEPR